MCGTHPEGCGKGNKAGDEDTPSTAKVSVQRSCCPASDETRAEVGSPVDEALNPSVGDTKFCEIVSARVSFIQKQCKGILLLRPVDSSLIHSLNNSRTSTQNYYCQSVSSFNGEKYILVIKYIMKGCDQRCVFSRRINSLSWSDRSVRDSNSFGS